MGRQGVQCHECIVNSKRGGGRGEGSLDFQALSLAHTNCSVTFDRCKTSHYKLYV